MTNIKPISDLRNYSEVLNEVTEDSPVYLTRNGRGEYAIITIKELDRLKATIRLLAELEKGEASAREKGWVSADEIKSQIGAALMLKVIFTPGAEEDLHQLANHDSALWGEDTAKRILEKTITEIDRLALYPSSGISSGNLIELHTK